MKNEIAYTLKKLSAAHLRLKESTQVAADELERDGVIKRFEFTFELFWKAIKALLEHEGFACAGPRSCIKEGAKRGFLKDAEAVLDMLEDRNKTSRIYDETTAGKIFERIKDQHVGTMKKNIAVFQDYLSRQA